MRLRYEGSSSIKDIISDLRLYNNKWIDFRVDVLWADGPTGYIRTYMKLPGQSNYVLVDEKTNYRTFAGNMSIGNLGYIKWGCLWNPGRAYANRLSRQYQDYQAAVKINSNIGYGQFSIAHTYFRTRSSVITSI